MSEVTDMVMPMLREMRSENPQLHGETARRLDLMDARLEKLEDAQSSFKQALTADSLLSKLVTGEFEQRIEALERKMASFEGRQA